MDAIGMLIEEGRAVLAAREMERRAAAEARAEELERELEAARDLFAVEAMALLPEVVREYVVVPQRIALQAWTSEASIVAPGCLAIRVKLKRTAERQGETKTRWMPWAWDGVYHVSWPWRVCGTESAGGEDALYIRYEGRETEELAIALAWAADGYARQGDLEREIGQRMEAYRAERAQAIAMQERWRAEREAAAADAELEAEMERERLLGAIEHDAVVMRVLELLVAVQEDRLDLAGELLG